MQGGVQTKVAAECRALPWVANSHQLVFGFWNRDHDFVATAVDSQLSGSRTGKSAIPNSQFAPADLILE
jgi:hypothetical protein